MERDRSLLFPLYLNQGSTGAAVLALQFILNLPALIAMRSSKNPRVVGVPLVYTGIYEEKTAEAVRALQRCPSCRVEDDGHFGPATRRALKLELGIDVEQWRRSLDMKTIAVFPDRSKVEW